MSKWINKFLKKVPQDGTDKPMNEGRLDVLSDFFDEPSEATSFTFYDTGLLDEYEERLAIAEYDGLQSPAQAERIAYLEALISTLTTLPYEDCREDWLSHRISTAQAWLLSQGISFPK